VVAVADRSWHEPIRYPIAVLRRTDHREAADAFVTFVMSARGQAMLAGFGFDAPVPVVGSVVAAAADDAVNADDAAIADDALSVSRERSAGSWRRVGSAFKLSLIAGTCALLVVFPVGTLVGALLARNRFAGRELLDAMFTLPMILPPTVTGYYLIVFLGARSPIGGWLESWFGVRVALTLVGAGLASAVISLPLMVKSARGAFESVNREYELASYSLGKGRIETWFRVTLPLARHGLLAGAILSFARAIGEFGATFMLAGIIPGKTMTMPVAIFHAFANHEDRVAQILVLTLTVFSVLVVYATNRLNARQTLRVSE
jgi:molybdate transport system permease protein